MYRGIGKGNNTMQFVMTKTTRVTIDFHSEISEVEMSILSVAMVKCRFLFDVWQSLEFLTSGLMRPKG